MIKVSVIVPVYNGEKHLRQCLDSICNQTLKEIEIICVDDGSTDSSMEILREYQKRDPRFQIYSQLNKYAGAARNLGKSHASGEYLAFWDCDDYFELDALELMYKQAKKNDADICVCGGNRWYEDLQLLSPNISTYAKKEYIPSEVFNHESNAQYIFNFTCLAAWNKLFRRTFIESLQLDFKPVRNGNDMYFTQCALGLANRITTVQKPLINYRINQGTSLVDTVSKSPITGFTQWIAIYETLAQSVHVPEQSFHNGVIANIIYILRNIKGSDAFVEAFNYLRNGFLDQLHFKDEGPDYYYTPWHNEFTYHLMHDTLENFKQFLLYATYRQVLEMEQKNNVLRQSINDLRNSKTFKVGNAIMRIPREIKALIKKG